MNFSIVLPTRERPEDLKTTLDSFLNNTRDLTQLEILLICDKDDPTLEKTIALCNDYAFNIAVYVRPRTDGHFCRDYYNWGAAKTKGKNIMCFNDDAQIRTNRWDDIALKHIGTRKIYMLSFMDSDFHVGEYSFPKFPMISRKAYEAVGFFFYPQVRMWSADNLCFQMYKESGTIIECPQVEILHEQHPSSTFKEWFELDKKEGVFPFPMDKEIYALLEARGRYDRTRT